MTDKPDLLHLTDREIIDLVSGCVEVLGDGEKLVHVDDFRAAIRTTPSSQGDTLDALDEAIARFGLEPADSHTHCTVLLWRASQELQAIKRSGMLLPEPPEGWVYGTITFSPPRSFDDDKDWVWFVDLRPVSAAARAFFVTALPRPGEGPTPASAAAEAVKRITTEAE